MTITATLEHPFWVEGWEPSGYWINAGDLRAGDVLLSADGRRLVVQATVRSAGPAMVYNFTVDALHTYTVTELRVVVHNTKKCLSIPEFRAELEKVAQAISRKSLSNNQRPNTVTLFETADGKLYIGQSSKASGQDRLIIKDTLENQSEHVFNYGCGEVDCFIQALKDNNDPDFLRDGKIGSVSIRGNKDNPTLTNKEPCDPSGNAIGCLNLVVSLNLTVVEY